MKQRGDPRLLVLPLVAAEDLVVANRAQRLARNRMRGIDVREVAGRTGLFTLGVHRRLVGRHVDRQAALAGDVGREIDRKAVGVVQLERHIARNDPAAEPGHRGFKNLEALVEGFREALLFLLQHALDVGALRAQLWIRIAHFLVERRPS